MSSSKSSYGLILPSVGKPRQPTFQASRNVFGDDSESDEDSPKNDEDSPKKPVLLQPNQNINRQAKASQEKAVIEDPTVYQYDEIYDSMRTQKEEVLKKNKEDKKPKYIENLLKSANKRKIENERRLERQIQKERENEGVEFADKEVFVTSAYKKKLKEMRLEEEKEKREEYLESIGDVTKQRDLGGFYRHLYEQKLGTDKKDSGKKSEKEIKQLEEDGGCQTPEPTEVFRNKVSKKSEILADKSDAKSRNYRKRKSSNNTNRSLSEGEIDDSDDEINRVNISEIRQAKRAKQVEENIDADSDFSIDDPSDEEDENLSNKDSKKLDTSLKKPEQVETSKENKTRKKDNEPNGEKKPEPPKPKIDIWKKRTVGEVFEEALKRFYERKAARGL